jgi:hypothetical protein
MIPMITAVVITKDHRPGEHYTGRLVVAGMKTNRRVKGTLPFVVARVPVLQGQTWP